MKKQMRSYKQIFIDADDTLFDYQLAEQFALERSFKEYGFMFNNDILENYSTINARLWKEIENARIDIETLKIERFRLLFDMHGINCSGQSFSRSYLRWLSKASFLIDDAEQVCEYLSKKYDVIIITNGVKDVQLPRLANSMIKPYVKNIVISEDAKSSKPDIGIFEYASVLTGYKDKDGMLIIGDSLSSDIIGGINYGIDTCWFNPKHIENQGDIKPDHEISKLIEIKNIL
jgi:2-haloacid dehalogenase